MKKIKTLLVLLLSVSMMFSFSACGLSEKDKSKLIDALEDKYAISAEDEEEETKPAETTEVTIEEEETKETEEVVVVEEPKPDLNDGTWAIYWYLCGSDLETNSGAATNDLLEMMNVTLPENVKVVIQTGGAREWQNNYVQSNKLQRFVYEGDELSLVEWKPNASMGEEETFEDFLRFAKTNYPAEHTALILWNHGGGSLRGVCFDENYRMDSLTNDEMEKAIADVFGYSDTNPALDIIGFDACLMASVDTALAMAGYAKYMVASEELEPGVGWNYLDLFDRLSRNTKMTDLDFAKLICDTYYEGCYYYDQADDITLSVTDLTKFLALYEEYVNFSQYVLVSAMIDPTVYNSFSRVAQNTENYGGNTREQGYANMLDLGDFISNPDTEAFAGNTRNSILEALNKCICYRIAGPYRTEATGLSFFYSYDADYSSFESFTEGSKNDYLEYFYSYGITGEMPDEAYEYLNSLYSFDSFDADDLQEIPTVYDMDWEDYPIYINEYGNSVLDLGSKASEVLTSVYFELFYYSLEDNIMLSLGNDNDIYANWDTGYFEDNFRGVWGAIDECYCYMELSYEGDGYNEYSIPILLNGAKYNMIVIYDFNEAEWSIVGARKEIDESGAANKDLRVFCEGDEITTLHYAMLLDDEDAEFIEVEMDTIYYSGNTSFGELDLGDGNFFLMYAMKDSQNNIVYSDPVYIEMDGDDIYLSPNAPF